MEKFEKIIEILAGDEYYKARKLISTLNDKNSFADKLITINNPYIYDRFTKIVEYEMYTSLYNKTRDKIIKKALLNQSNDKRLDYFKNITKQNYHDYSFTSGEIKYIEESNDFEASINYISNRWLTEYISYYFFQDNYYNFLANFYEMVSYLSKEKINLVDRHHIDLYNEFRGLNTMSFKDKLDLFKKHVNEDYTEIFYEDMRKTKDNSYQKLVDSSIKLEHDLDIYCKDISKKAGVDIYYLNGEKFYAFVKSFAIDKNDLSKDYSKYFFSPSDKLGHSFSFIGDKNIGTVDYTQKGVTLLYDNIDYHNIMYVHHSDLHTKKMTVQNDFVSEKINEITTPNSLIASTINYNEIYIASKPIPKALVCYDTISDTDLLFAKKYNLAITLINRNKYKRYETYDDDYTLDTYVL